MSKTCKRLPVPDLGLRTWQSPQSKDLTLSKSFGEGQAKAKPKLVISPENAPFDRIHIKRSYDLHVVS